MAIYAGINGFGRIGRAALRVLAARRDDFEIVLINDLAEPETLAHLLRHDSVYGAFPGEVVLEDRNLFVDGMAIRLTQERDPSRLPWGEAGVDIVLESSGAFSTREGMQKHLAGGAPQVLLSAPVKGKERIDLTVIRGVNDDQLTPEMTLVSNGSCTTNCVVPMAKVLHDNFGIESGLMTTSHAYTASQQLVDGLHKDLRRARAAPQNIIPTTTGAADLIGEIIPDLQGRLTGLALRVPIACGSITDLTVTLEKSVSSDDVNQAFRAAAEGHLAGIVQYTEEPLVSSDIVGNSHSCILDGGLTQERGGRLVKVLGWYDNEWGYACRCIDILEQLTSLRLARTTA